MSKLRIHVEIWVAHNAYFNHQGIQDLSIYVILRVYGAIRAYKRKKKPIFLRLNPERSLYFRAIYLHTHTLGFPVKEYLI